jgi:hypothetical protein
VTLEQFIEILDVLVDAPLVYICTRMGRVRGYMQCWGINAINLAEHTE